MPTGAIQDAAFEEARKIREDAKRARIEAIRRAHAGGALNADIARLVGCSRSFVDSTLARLNLKPNASVRLTKRKSFAALRRALAKRRK